MLKAQVHSHDSRKDRMVLLGSSKNGTEMDVNEMAVNADRLVIITSVEPHYFAGYTGGRKSFLPGVASFRTIEQNHRLAMRPDAQAIALDGNPVHEDMMDALQVVKERRYSPSRWSWTGISTSTGWRPGTCSVLPAGGADGPTRSSPSTISRRRTW